MKRGLGILTCLLLGACGQETDVVIDDIETVTEMEQLTVCKGLREKECKETLETAQAFLPDELEDELIKTIGRIEIYVGDKYSFLDYMSNKRIHVDTIEYSGITGYGYEDKTIIYSMADDYVLMHELGHAYEYSYWYDGVKDNPSVSAEWKYAYDTEYISAYGTTSAMEFYAECFAMYFRSPKTLKMLCPIAYDLLDKEFGNME